MVKASSGLYRSSLLHSVGCVHGMTTRRHGDMREKGNRTVLLKPYGAGDDQLVRCEQVHGNSVGGVTDGDKGTKVPGVDGLVADGSVFTGVLGVLTADCVPVFLFDPSSFLIGIAHSGWKGTVGHITLSLLSQMEHRGADKKNIHVAIGHHIGPCCYSVSGDRASLFTKEFPDEKRVITQKNGRLFCDLGRCVYDDIKKFGIQNRHIDYSPVCTSCHDRQFYSFRKTTPETFGEMLSFIGCLGKGRV